MPLLINSIKASCFRGVSSALAIDFSPKRPGDSVLIFGENGSGKSSVVDAAEFALLGSLGEAKGISAHAAWTNLRNHFSPSTPTRVEVNLSDGSTCYRELVLDEKGSVSYKGKKDARFAGKPLVLRRQDIQRFWSTPAEHRRLVFLHYFGSPSREALEVETPEDRQARLGAELTRATAERRRIALEIGKRFRVDPHAIPTDDQITKWIHRQVALAARTQKRVSWREVASSLTKDDHNLISRYKSACEAISKLREAKVAPLSSAPASPSESTFFAEINTWLTGAVKAVSPRLPAERLEVVVRKSSATELSVIAHLPGGARVDSQSILSEANRDLVAVMIFFAIARARVGVGGPDDKDASKTLILDDVFQSVDSAVRVGAIRYLISEFSDWQFIVTCHDRLWREQVRQLFRAAGRRLEEVEIADWSSQGGPRLASARSPSDGLNDALRKSDPNAIVREAGYLLEMLSNQLSWRLGISVQRRRDDRYTLGDLWPGVQKSLKRTALEELCSRIGGNVFLRNVAGAHFNEFAQTLSLDDARAFGEDVARLFGEIYCAKCGEMPERHSEGVFICPCSKLTLSRVT